MTITIDIKPELQAELARQAAAQGMGVGDYAASLLEEVTYILAPAGPPAEAAQEPRAAAIERLKTFGKTHGLSLDGMTLRQLRHEARP